MKPNDWNKMADRMCASLTEASEPIDIMARASWECSKGAFHEPKSDEEWAKLIRDDVVAQVAALQAAGYAIIPSSVLQRLIENVKDQPPVSGREPIDVREFVKTL